MNYSTGHLTLVWFYDWATQKLFYEGEQYFRAKSRGHTVMWNCDSTLYSFSVFFCVSTSNFSSFSPLSATFLFVFALLHLFPFWFTSEMCPNFNGIPSKRVAYHRQATVKWPTCAGLQLDLSLYCTAFISVPRCCAWRQAAALGWAFADFPLSSRIRRPLFSFSGGRRKKRMEDGRICKLCHHQRRGRGVSHRLSVKECSPSPTRTHTLTGLWIGLFLLTHTGLQAHITHPITQTYV